jgi:hypothetical protein
MPTGTPRPLSLLRAGGWLAKPKVYDGYRYRSTAEANYAARLDLLVDSGKILDWRRATFYRIEVNGIYCGRYTPDFVIVYLDGSEELIEVKGWAARDFLFRYNVFRASRPDLKITVVDGDGQPYDPNQRRRGSDAAVRKLVREGRAR